MFLSLEVKAVPLFLRNGFCGALRLSLAVAVAADAVNTACGLGLLFERRNALEHLFDRFGELVAEDFAVGVGAAVAVGKGQHIVDRIHRDALLDRCLEVLGQADEGIPLDDDALDLLSAAGELGACVTPPALADDDK